MDYDQVTRMNIPCGVSPFVEWTKLCNVLMGPMFPEVSKHNCQRLSKDMDPVGVVSGNAANGLPIRKWPGVSASIPSSSLGSGTRGLLLRHALICVSRVENYSYVRLTSRRMRLRWVFIDLTAASHSPPKWGARWRMNIQVIFCSLR